MNAEKLHKLILAGKDEGIGITFMYAFKGSVTCAGSDEVYERDGWEVGYLTPFSGGAISFADDLESAVDAALATFTD